jgi:hypothetical protein
MLLCCAGTRISYNRNALMQMRNSPKCTPPVGMQAVPGVTAHPTPNLAPAAPVPPSPAPHTSPAHGRSHDGEHHKPEKAGDQKEQNGDGALFHMDA